MIFGCIINFYAYETKTMNRKCSLSNDNIKYSFIMYFTYFLLFFQFFIKSYFRMSITQQNQRKGETHESNNLFKDDMKKMN